MRNGKPMSVLVTTCAGGVWAHARDFQPPSQGCDGIPRGETFNDQKQTKHFGWKACMFTEL